MAASGFELGQNSRTRVRNAAHKVHKLQLAAWINYNVPVAFIAGCNDDYEVTIVEGEYIWHFAVGVPENIHRHDKAVHAKSTQGRPWMRGWNNGLTNFGMNAIGTWEEIIYAQLSMLSSLTYR